MIVEVTSDAAALAEAAAARVARHAAEAIRERGRFTIALAGGSTPRATHERLAAAPDTVDWARADVLFGDERAVPPDHPDSNFRMARETLLDRVPVDPDRVHRMEGERDDLDAAARAYETTLRRVVGGDDAIPRLDLVLLGVGDDGHTASLFPDVVHEGAGPDLVKAIDSAAKGRRLTLTLSALNAARTVVFLVGGEKKASVMRTILLERGGTPPFPAARVRPENGDLVWLLDREAASTLREAASSPSRRPSPPS